MKLSELKSETLVLLEVITKDKSPNFGVIHVHLSKDLETASTVGCRYGELVIYEVDAKKMHEDGSKFYQSVNGVWLVDKVPVAYLKKLELNKTV